MSVQVKRRRDTAANLASFVGAQAELLVDTTNNRLQVHDGATAGGWPAAKLSEVLTNTRTAIADANYTALASDRTIAFTSLTTSRVVTLPAASVFPTGAALLVIDESGSASATNTITLARAGSDTIDGAASAVVSSACGYLAVQSNGANKWTIAAQSASNLAGVGIGTPIDPANSLSVFGTSTLFNSSGDVRVTLNKAASTNTASFLYQDGFSGRAEIGLAGDDNFHFKVSPDGATWNQGIVIDRATGAVTLGNARTAVADAAYTILPTDRLVAYTSLTAARTVTLPAASAFPAGTPLIVVDESGACSGINTITVVRAGSDTINGVASFVIAVAYGFVKLESSGAGAWTIVGSPSPQAYPGQLTYVARSVQLNATGDTIISIVMPPGFSRWALSGARLCNASGSLAAGSARVGLYTAPSQGGTVWCSQQAVTAITTGSPDTVGGAIALAANFSANNSFFTDTKLYFNVGTANGTNATVDVILTITPYS